MKKYLILLSAILLVVFSVNIYSSNNHDEKESGHDEAGHNHDEKESGHDEAGHNHDEKESGHDEVGHNHDEKESGHDEAGHNHDEKESGHEEAHDHEEKGHAHSEEEGGHHEEGKEDEHGHHGSSKAIGPGKAIMEIDEKLGFKLSPEATSTLGVKFLKIESQNLLVTKNTLVTIKMKKGIYRFRKGFYKFIECEILKVFEDKYLLKLPEIEKDDQYVVSAVGIIAIADVYSTDKSEYGHGH